MSEGFGVAIPMGNQTESSGIARTHYPLRGNLLSTQRAVNVSAGKAFF